MNSRDQVMKIGITDPQGGLLWDQIRYMTYSQVLQMRRQEQEMSARAFKGDNPEDAEMKCVMVRRGMLLETYAWRIYMFGSDPMGLYPGRMGELRKRQRNDPGYWRYLVQSNERHGTQGCQQFENIFRKVAAPCAKQGCNHQGQKHADKWLKRQMRMEWESALKSQGYIY